MNRLLCACGHSHTPHRHYTVGTDCSAGEHVFRGNLARWDPCGCRRWQWRWTHPFAWLRWRRYWQIVASRERGLGRA